MERTASRFVQRRKTFITRQKAEDLLFPLAMFLGLGGLSMKDAEASFSSAYRRALAKADKIRVEHIGHPTPYADIMGLWTKDKRFLTTVGRPMALPAQGKISVAALVREACPASRLKNVLDVLVRYGNIRRTRTNRYELVKPYFTSDTSKSIAFEPIAYFLSDASITLRRLLSQGVKARKAGHFWRKVETGHLTAGLARRFSAFARERTLTYLEELDDWLDAHKRKSSRARGNRRVGVGVFSIYSDE
jgi:hypothetical protein